MKSFIACLFIVFLSGCQGSKKDFSGIETGFVSPPDSIRISVYWFWVSDNISREGVIKDLEAMKKAGIGRAFIAFIGLQETPYGPVKMFSEEWWDILHAALRTAGELDIEIGIFNSAGWSQSGGPWVKPEQSMRYLAASDTLLRGPQSRPVRLSTPGNGFRDVRVLAFRKPDGYGESVADRKPVVHTRPGLRNTEHLFDNDPRTYTEIPAAEETVIDIVCTGGYTARNLAIYPAERNMSFDVILEAETGGTFQPVKSFRVDRSNTALNVGFIPFAPVVESFPETTAKIFRLRIVNPSRGAAIAGIDLSGSMKVARYPEKTLAKMHPTPLPPWEEYQWERPGEMEREGLAVNEQDILDISGYLTAEGILDWPVPEGEWVVLRCGMLPTGVTNTPASPESIGPEVDKMSKEHAVQHFDSFLGEIYRRIQAEDRRTWRVAVMDSYEVGGQNWTDDFTDSFKERFHYDPTPYIPTMFGHVVGSRDRSERFLWDLRRFIADQVAYGYVGGFREASNHHGLRLWLENYGHWGFPAEFLQYGGQADEVAGEFWAEGDLGNIENRAASSAAHIYGKNIVYSESFTAAGNTFGRYPAMLKKRGDRFFTEGVNSTLLNTSIQQPDDRAPGVNALFGTEFNRLNTWFGDMDLFVDYLKRCNFMLQQGTYVADVAYFIGEDAPKMTGVQDPPLPRGYSFDYINAEVILTRLSVRDGYFVLLDGMRYRLLVLPPLETMTPGLLAKIEQLVKAGGAVLGPKPQRSPSLTNYGSADQEVRRLSTNLWGEIDREKTRINRYGAGLVMDGMTIQEALDELRIIPDMQLHESDSVLFIHRRMDNGDIYFLSNQSARKTCISPAFRTVGKIPELWNAIDGSIRELPDFIQNEARTTVPLELDGYESAFIVFRQPGRKKEKSGDGKNYPDPLQVITHSVPWTVTFDPASRGPEKPVVFNRLTDWSQFPDTSVAYYSGTATYQSVLYIPEIRLSGSRMELDLGEVVALAKVTLNGEYVGGVWTAPYCLDITDVVRPGENTLEIHVVNTWPNRLIGDQHLPASQRRTHTYINPYTADSSLHKAGLLGPVTVREIPE